MAGSRCSSTFDPGVRPRPRPAHSPVSSHKTLPETDMAEYRRRLPQLEGGLFLTDGGIETTLVFHEGAVLPYFASFVPLADKAGQAMLRRYFERYAGLAKEGGL